MPWEYCARSWTSIALKASSMGYRLHGHDVEVEACIESNEIVDVEELARALDDILRAFDYKPLWEEVEREDPLLEDLLLAVYQGLVSRGLKPVSIMARLPRGRVIKLKPR